MLRHKIKLTLLVLKGSGRANIDTITGVEVEVINFCMHYSLN